MAPESSTLPTAIERAFPGSSTAVRALRQRIQVLAHRGMPVLVEGPAGSGACGVARAIHALGPTRHGARLEIDVRGQSDTMVAGALFGCERPQSSGGTAVRPGLLEQADGGMVVIRHAERLGAALQAALVQLIDRGTFVRVGGQVSLPVRVRLVLTTHADLAMMVRHGRMGVRLAERLLPGRVRLPALWTRPDDVPAIAAQILADMRRAGGTEIEALSDGAAGVLSAYSWPGELRELAVAIHAAGRGGRGPLLAAVDLPAEVLAAVVDHRHAPVKEARHA